MDNKIGLKKIANRSIIISFVFSFSVMLLFIGLGLFYAFECNFNFRSDCDFEYHEIQTKIAKLYITYEKCTINTNISECFDGHILLNYTQNNIIKTCNTTIISKNNNFSYVEIYLTKNYKIGTNYKIYIDNNGNCIEKNNFIVSVYGFIIMMISVVLFMISIVLYVQLCHRYKKISIEYDHNTRMMKIFEDKRDEELKMINERINKYKKTQNDGLVKIDKESQV